MRHLKDSKMSYFEHLGFAMKLAVHLNIMAFVSFIHAIFPFMRCKTMYLLVLKL